MASASAAGPAPPELLAPVRSIPPDDGAEPPVGVALCLSGGGYRAMLFHLGVLRRLNEAGWLGRLDRVSSVSGGSIAAGALALAWSELDPDDGGRFRAFDERVLEPVRGLASHGLDVGAVLTGLLTPDSAAERLAKAYKHHLFGDATLQDLPESPLFVFCATNVGSGELARLERRQLADWRVGRVERPDIALADAVACSSAFPPVLSPYRLDCSGFDWLTEDDNDLATNEFRRELVLSDGGVYDNLGLETAWKRCRTVIVSDAGGQMVAESHPESDWGRHMLRVLKVIDNQVRALRKRQVIEGLKRGDRDGVYVGIRSHVADYGLSDPFETDPARTLELANVPTRLDDIGDRLQERLINWGYAICDTGLRRHLDSAAGRPDALPYPPSGI